MIHIYLTKGSIGQIFASQNLCVPQYPLPEDGADCTHIMELNMSVHFKGLRQYLPPLKVLRIIVGIINIFIYFLSYEKCHILYHTAISFFSSFLGLI